jgi:hypothetical protein
MAKYIKTESYVTFYPGQDISYVVPKSSFYFSLLTEETLDNLGDFFTARELKQRLTGDGTPEEKQLVNGALQSLAASNLSGVALINFWNNTLDSIVNPADRLVLLKRVLQGQVITWDGHLILNSRSSFLSKGELVPMNTPYEFNRMYSNLSRPAIAGSVEWVGMQCPDAGNIYEVLVQVSDLVVDSIRNEETSTSKFTYLFNRFTYLEDLRIRDTKGSNLESSVTTNNSVYGCLKIRKPHTLEATKEYLKSLSVGTNVINQPEVVPVRLSGC